MIYRPLYVDKIMAYVDKYKDTQQLRILKYPAAASLSFVMDTISILTQTEAKKPEVLLRKDTGHFALFCVHFQL